MDEQTQQLIQMGQQIIQAAQQGDQQAAQIVQAAQQIQSEEQMAQVQQAAQQGDESAIAVIAVIAASQAAQSAKFGAKLNYIRSLRGICPDGYETQYFKAGGQLCKKCVKKKQAAPKKEEGGNMSALESYRCGGKKTKKKQEGGDVEMDKCGGKTKKASKGCGLKKVPFNQEPNGPLYKITPDTAVVVPGYGPIRGQREIYQPQNGSGLVKWIDKKSGKTFWAINEGAGYDEFGYPEVETQFTEFEKNRKQNNQKKKEIIKNQYPAGPLYPEYQLPFDYKEYNKQSNYAKKLIENEEKTHLPEIQVVGNNKGTKSNPIKLPTIMVFGYPNRIGKRGSVFPENKFTAFVNPFTSEWDRDIIQLYKQN